MTQERDRLRDWILAEARGGDWLSLWPAVASSRARLIERLAGFSEEQARWRPSSGEGEAAWSAIEVAAHVIAYSRNVCAIIEATAAGETVPKDPPGTVGAAANLPFAELVESAIAESVHLSSLPERLPSEPHLETTVPHAFFGPLNCRGWYVFLRLHDSDHTRQLERLRELPGFPEG